MKTKRIFTFNRPDNFTEGVADASQLAGLHGYDLCPEESSRELAVFQWNIHRVDLCRKNEYNSSKRHKHHCIRHSAQTDALKH